MTSELLSHETVKEMLVRLLQQALKPELLNVVDESHLHAGHYEAGSAESTHFRIIIKSAQLAGKNRVQQHQLIYKSVESLMNRPIHALAIEVLQGQQHQA